MTQRFGKHGDKTVEQLIQEDPAYIIWLYETAGDNSPVSYEQYGMAINSLSLQDETALDYEFGMADDYDR